MQIKANGRWAIIVVAGLLALSAGPVNAACDKPNCGRIVGAQTADSKTQAGAATEAAAGKTAKRNGQHARASSRHKTEKLAAKSSTSAKTPPGSDKTADQVASQPDSGKAAVPAAVANANAQMIGPASPADAAKPQPDGQATGQDGTQGAAGTTTGQDSDPVVAAASDADAQIVASDQLNDLDRAAVDEKGAPRILRLVSQTSQVNNAGTDDAWNQTSLIGKIFIAFGGFLTLASAARMFIA